VCERDIKRDREETREEKREERARERERERDLIGHNKGSTLREAREIQVKLFFQTHQIVHGITAFATCYVHYEH